MKQSSIIITLIAIIISVGNVCSAFAEQTPTVQVGNNQYACIIENSQTYIPMRDVFEALGYKVDWIGADKAVVLSKNDMELTLYTTTNNITGYGVLKNKVIIVNSRTYLPLRELLNILGYKVDWDANTKTAIILLSDMEAITEATTNTTTESTSEATTETTTDVVYDNADLYIGDTPIRSKQELVNAVLENIAKQMPSVDELISMVSVGDTTEELG